MPVVLVRPPLRVIDLFSGIGGFSFGLEKTGHFQTIAFCEIDPLCQKILKKHWPGVPVHDDVRSLDFRTIHADIVTGGFPCQDISHSGNREGITGARSCLWSEIKRAICEIRPRYAVVENVAALTVRGIDTVFADLAEVGYDGQWHCIPASALGAVHHRDRVWIIAYPRESGRAVAATIYVAIADRCHPPGIPGEGVSVLAQVSELRLDEPLPDVRKYDGIPETVDRIGAVGNSIYPEVAEIIGLAILEAENYS